MKSDRKLKASRQGFEIKDLWDLKDLDDTRSLQPQIAVERKWQIQDSQGQTLALAFMSKSFTSFKGFPLRSKMALMLPPDLTAVSIYDKYSIGPSMRSMCTRCCFTMTNMMQVWSNFRWARVFIINTRPDEIDHKCVATAKDTRKCWRTPRVGRP